MENMRDTGLIHKDSPMRDAARDALDWPMEGRTYMDDCEHCDAFAPVQLRDHPSGNIDLLPSKFCKCCYFEAGGVE